MNNKGFQETYSDEMLRDRIRGSLVGGAIGDQMGYPVEFMSRSAILSRYGENGVTGFSGEKVFSDDTQMTLYTACGLLESAGKGERLSDGICRAYTEWYRTQTGGYPMKDFRCWISGLPQLYRLRAPGNTCMSAMGSIMSGQEPVNDSKGCGGVMRVAPVALYGAARGMDDAVEYDYIAYEAARITHLHPLGCIPAFFVSHLIFRLATDCLPSKESLQSYAQEAMGIVGGGCWPDEMNQFAAMVRRAVMLADSDKSDAQCVRILGEGWTADETAAIALFSCLRHFGDFAKVMESSVNHDGDSDSTGAVAGNIMGAAVGYGAIPEKFKTQLELRDVILHVADDLWRGQITEYKGNA